MRDRRLAALGLYGWLVLRAAFLAWLLLGAARGLYFYSGDYPGRVLIAYRWLQQPSWLLGGIWLPGNFFLTGLVLRLWGDPLLAPAVFHILLSSASMALVFAITRELFPERPWAPLWAVSWLAFEPLLAQLSVSGGASEVDAQFFLLAAGWLWLRCERSRRGAELFGCAALFGAAGFIRHEAWCFMAWPALSFARRAWRGEARRALPALLLMWAPAAAWMASRAAQGNLFLLPLGSILDNLRSGVPLARTGHASVWRLFWAYPQVLWRHYRWFLLACVPGGAWALTREAQPRMRGYLGWLALAFFGHCLTPVFSIVFAPAPERIAVAFLPFLAPFLGLGLDEAARRAARLWRPAAAVLAGVVLAWTWSAAQEARLDVPQYEPCNADVRAAAFAIRDLRPKLGPRARLLVEIAEHAGKDDPNVIWDDMVFQWAGAPFATIDRKNFALRHHDDGSYDLAPGADPSVFADRAGLRGYLERESIGFALVRSSAAAANLAGLMRPLSSVGPYTLLARAGN